MGVLHYLVCDQCKEYIDLDKSYAFYRVLTADRPPFARRDEKPDTLHGNYWESRGMWFLWHHRSHADIRIMTDMGDDWYALEPYLKEVFPHDEDLPLRKEPPHDK